ncbi:dTDP-4-dehydrorhamnose 3,5-epimerase family protein [Methylosinus sp. Ce-a6]|uniref:dTDP-4-dehydrorhamnose 3,5-epimerase family protein n=1 Tax=Methylosinus sp. Ce-a6 TaxID=2172005 RepID=UPI001FCE991F|nr:dTDP-4-dehydrorhamnose 3,5-epimerase family protein [Methylosinus sp. Ce-a6]
MKTFHAETFAQLGVDFEVREEFYTTSCKGVLRGMHFQIPPHHHDKLVCCMRGRVLDVLLDLRAGAGYGASAAVELSGDNCYEIYVPKGVAHGFLSLADDTLMLYKTSTIHAPSADRGIRWNSFGFDWGVDDPIVSRRDAEHPSLTDFVSPF